MVRFGPSVLDGQSFMCNFSGFQDSRQDIGKTPNPSHTGYESSQAAGVPEDLLGQ